MGEGGGTANRTLHVTGKTSSLASGGRHIGKTGLPEGARQSARELECNRVKSGIGRKGTAGKRGFSAGRSATIGPGADQNL